MRTVSLQPWLGTVLAVALAAGPGRGQEKTDDVRALRDLVQQQQKQIEALNQKVNALTAPPVVQAAAQQKGQDQPPKSLKPPKGKESGGPPLKEVQPGPNGEQKPAAAPPAAPTQAQVNGWIADYLKANPGIGMPPGVQTGFFAGQGFVIRSAPNPAYVPWSDDSRIPPFELRLRGRAQLDYYGYKVTDNLNHLTGIRYQPEVGDFSQLEVKRLRLLWEGYLFTPDLRYQIQLDGNTRGLGGFQNNRIIQNAGTPPEATGAAPGLGGAVSPIGGGDTIDHAVRLFTTWVAYDIHLGSHGGCGCACPEGTYNYSPTLTFIVGKQQPFFGFTEILGSANAQFVDFAMADWFFDADDNNMLTAAAVQYRDFDDRLFATAMITNGNESQFPNVQMDRLPGFITGLWYDFGGDWDPQAKRWNLYGNSPSDLDWSPNPVVRVGGAANLVPMSRRSIYGDVEQSRVFVTPGGPGGTRLINLFNGDAATPAGSHAVDKFDSYTFDTWASLHYRGFSLTNEWWFRSLNNFHTERAGNNQIIYQDSSGANALFPVGHGLFDMGSLIQGGYFLIPKKLEIVGRYSTIAGDSGDINGTGRFSTVRIAGLAAPVRVDQGAFTHLHQANEVAVGFNYFFYGQLVKWSTDLSWYQGGNPAAGSTSPAGYIAGVDGWLFRTQLQVAF